MKSIYKKANGKGDKQVIVGDYNLAVDEIVWPPIDYCSHPLLATYTKDNPVNQENRFNFSHPFDRCAVKGVKIKTTKLVGPGKGTLSDHYGLLFNISRK